MTETVLVGDGGKAKRPRPRWPFIVGLVVALVLAGGAGVLARYIQNKAEQKSNSSQKDKAPDSVEDARYDLQAGKVDEVAKNINDKLADSKTSNEEKHLLYIEQARVAIVKEDYKAAADSLTKAWEIKETYDVARRLGSISQQLGDNEKAITYYKRALQLNTKDNPLYESENINLQAQIEVLESGQ
jgi:tetratricopeptide (TPR) repeat protein